MERRKLLVTGCGRSGTAYASIVWRAAGLDVRHEMPVPPHGTMGKDGMVSWYMAVEDPHPPYGPSRCDFTFDLVIQQVRHPLAVIPSAAQFLLNHDASRIYIERNAPQTRPPLRDSLRPRKNRLLLQAMRYWYHWNLLAAAKADETVCVERLIPSLSRLCRRLGVPLDAAAVDAIPTDLNSRSHYVDQPHWTVGWNDLARLDRDLCRKVRELAESYGYDEPDHLSQPRGLSRPRGED